jgi:Golgi SNAP receptor complex protein 1
VHLYF